MAGYLFLYRHGAEKKEDLSAEEMQAVMQRWMDWIDQASAEGWMTSPGDALKADGRTLRADKSTTDGPFVESKEVVAGYSLIEAADLDKATEYARGCPIFHQGGTVEIRELAMATADRPVQA